MIDRDIGHKNKSMAMLPIFQGRLAIYSKENSTSKNDANIMKIMSNLKGRF